MCLSAGRIPFAFDARDVLHVNVSRAMRNGERGKLESEDGWNIAMHTYLLLCLLLFCNITDGSEGMRRTLRRGAGASWIAALQHALMVNAAVDVDEQDRRCCTAMDLLLRTHIPQHRREVINPKILSLVRQCRWALMQDASNECRAKMVQAMLEYFVSASHEQWYEVGGDDTCDAAPSSSPSLQEGAKLLMIEAMEIFAEGRVYKLPLTEAHYAPFVSSPMLPQMDETCIDSLVRDFEQRGGRTGGSTTSTSAAAVRVRLAGASAYAAARMPHRAAALVARTPEVLVKVVEHVVASHRSGWLAALRFAEVATGGLLLAEGADSPSGNIHALCAALLAADAANRKSPSPLFFDRLAPAIKASLNQTPLPTHTHEAHTDSSDQEGLSTRGGVHMVMHTALHLCHPLVHWQQVLSVYDVYVTARGTCEKEAVTTTSSSSTEDLSTVLGRVMHVLSMAHRWQESLKLYQQCHTTNRASAPPQGPHGNGNSRDEVALHPSVANHTLHAVAQSLAQRSDGSTLDVQPLVAFYESIPIKNKFSHLSFLRALTSVSSKVCPRGAGWSAALAAMQHCHGHDTASVRVLEDTAIHVSRGGHWEATLSLMTTAGHADSVAGSSGRTWSVVRTAEASRYALLIALASCVQQGKDAYLIEGIAKTIAAQRTVSMKQIALAAAMLVASEIPLSQQKGGTATATITTTTSPAAWEALALPLSTLITCQKDFDAFADVFLGYACSAVQHRAKAMSSATQSLHALIESSPSCQEISPQNILSNIMRTLELPPSAPSGRAALVKVYARAQDAHSGSLKVNWQRAIGLLSRASVHQSSGHHMWSSSVVPTTVMQHGWHQDVVVHCL